jgi:hypothetical protein
MKKIFLLIVFISISQLIAAQQKIFKGGWFDIKYPSNFMAKGSLKNTEGFLSATFKSPDNLVEFYIFCSWPPNSRQATDILIKPKEKLSSSKEIETKDGTKYIKWWTITALDGSYSRSYQDTWQNNMGWIFGIKYKNASALEKYKKEYATFKASLISYGD